MKSPIFQQAAGATDQVKGLPGEPFHSVSAKARRFLALLERKYAGSPDPRPAKGDPAVNPITTMDYLGHTADAVTLTVYDVRGLLVSEIGSAQWHAARRYTSPFPAPARDAFSPVSQRATLLPDRNRIKWTRPVRSNNLDLLSLESNFY